MVELSNSFNSFGAWTTYRIRVKGKCGRVGNKMNELKLELWDETAGKYWIYKEEILHAETINRLEA